MPPKLEINVAQVSADLAAYEYSLPVLGIVRFSTDLPRPVGAKVLRLG